MKNKDGQDEPLIYTGPWTPEWAKGREIRTYASIGDVANEYGDRLCRVFNRCLEYVNAKRNGERLADRPPGARDVTYEMAMAARIMELQPGQRTGHMIPTYELLRGQKYPGDKVTHRNNMYDLRHTGDFAKADNGGFDSRFVTEVARGSVYMSSSEPHESRIRVLEVAFTDGSNWYSRKHDILGGCYLRTFVAELPQP